ncbi:MAG TPA: secretin N-terminal domain-containing protein, partial [Burkholderiaceae bacterium]
MRIKLIIAAATFTCLQGCGGLTQKIDKGVDDTDAKASKLVKRIGHAAPDGMVGPAIPAAEHENGIWIGKNIVKLGQPSLPAVFYEEATFDRTVTSLSELAERLTLRSGIPTKVSLDAQSVANSVTQATQGGTPGATPGGMQTPPGLGPTQNGTQQVAKAKTPVRISYANGTFKGLLDTVAARFGVYWKFANGTIQFFYTDSRTFQIVALPGDSTFSASVTSQSSSTGGVESSGGSSSGGSSGSGGVSSHNGQNTGITSQLSVYSSIEKTVASMLSSHGKVVSSPATGTMTVVDTPDTLDHVAEFIETENKSLSRQITINVTVLSVTLNQQDNYGIQWNLVYKNLLDNYNIENTITPPKGSTSFTAGILKGTSGNFAGSNVVINA